MFNVCNGKYVDYIHKIFRQSILMSMLTFIIFGSTQNVEALFFCVSIGNVIVNVKFTSTLIAYWRFVNFTIFVVLLMSSLLFH